MKLPKAVALWLALRKATTPEAKRKARRSIGSRYAKRKPKISNATTRSNNAQ